MSCHLRRWDEHTQRQGWGAYYPSSDEDLRDFFFGRKAQHLSGVTQPSLNLSNFLCPCPSMEHRRKDDVVLHMDISRWIFKGLILNICVQLRWKQVWSFLQAPPHIFGHLNTIKSLSWAPNPPLRGAGRNSKPLTREWGLEANVQLWYCAFYPIEQLKILNITPFIFFPSSGWNHHSCAFIHITPLTDQLSFL